MARPILLFRIDVGFDPERGYAASVLDLQNQRVRGIKGNSIQQITSRLRNVLNEEMETRRQFPMEHERSPAEPSRIITPNGYT
jgi:hypothetical protein